MTRVTQDQKLSVGCPKCCAVPQEKCFKLFPIGSVLRVRDEVDLHLPPYRSHPERRAEFLRQQASANHEPPGGGK